MKRNVLELSATALLFMAATCHAESAHRWEFNSNGDREKWTISEYAGGVVMGGSLWLTRKPKEKDWAKISGSRYQVYGDLDETTEKESAIDVQSPSGLNVSAAKTGLPEGDLVVLLPGTPKEHHVPMKHSFTAEIP